MRDAGAEGLDSLFPESPVVFCSAAVSHLPSPASVPRWAAGKPARPCVGLHEHTCTHTLFRVHTLVQHALTCTWVHTCSHTCAQPTCTHMYVHMHTCSLTHSHAHTLSHTDMHTLTFSHVHTLASISPSLPPFPVQAGAPTSHISIPGRCLCLVCPLLCTLWRGPAHPHPHPHPPPPATPAWQEHAPGGPFLPP